MELTLTPDLEELVRRKVEGGKYRSADEVVHAALRLLEHQDRLREEIRRGTEQADRGELADGAEAIRRARGSITTRGRAGE